MSRCRSAEDGAWGGESTWAHVHDDGVGLLWRRRLALGGGQHMCDSWDWVAGTEISDKTGVKIGEALNNNSTLQHLDLFGELCRVDWMMWMMSRRGFGA